MSCKFELFILLLCIGLDLCPAHAQSESFSSRFDRQRQLYQQERLCVVTDRSCYQPGERVWFRAFVVDAVLMSPVSVDRYVYAELVDGRGFVVKRVKVTNRNGVFSGYLDIPSAIYPSRYFLRCYTLFSASLKGYECIVPVAVGNVNATKAVCNSQTAIPLETGVLRVADVGEAFKVWSVNVNYLPLRLLAVARGCVEYDGLMEKAVPMFFKKKDMIQGVTQFVVCNDSMRVVDRKLVFSPYGDGVAEMSFVETDSCVGSDGKRTFLLSLPAKETGTVCLSVTADAGSGDVPSAMAQLLLSQEIKGGVCCPDRFFSNGYRAASLDTLLSQAVASRYCVDSVVCGRYAVPPVAHETTQVVTGRAMVTAPYSGHAAFAKVSVISPKANMYSMSEADGNGHFTVGGLDFADSTSYVVNAVSTNPHEKTEVRLDEVSFPQVDIASLEVQKGSSYAKASETRYDASGSITLDDVVVTATRKKHDVGTFSSMADYSVTADEIEYLDATCIHEVLRRIPCIYMKGDTAYIRGKISIYGNPHAAVAIDGSIVDDQYDLDNIQLQDIGRIDVFKTGSAVIWGAKGGPGVISITTKKGVSVDEAALKNRVSRYTPLGYQRPVDVFEDSSGNGKTVYWNGDVRLVDGKAVLKLSLPHGHVYTVRAEGVTHSGLIVHLQKKLE